MSENKNETEKVKAADVTPAPDLFTDMALQNLREELSFRGRWAAARSVITKWISLASPAELVIAVLLLIIAILQVPYGVYYVVSVILLLGMQEIIFRILEMQYTISRHTNWLTSLSDKYYEQRDTAKLYNAIVELQQIYQETPTSLSLLNYQTDKLKHRLSKLITIHDTFDLNKNYLMLKKSETLL